jgi:nitrogen fixation-related uncharacterized protein
MDDLILIGIAIAMLGLVALYAHWSIKSENRRLDEELRNMQRDLGTGDG